MVFLIIVVLLLIDCAGFAAKVEAETQFAVDDFRLCPERGYVLQPRVAASATLGTKAKRIQPQRGCEISY